MMMALGIGGSVSSCGVDDSGASADAIGVRVVASRAVESSGNGGDGVVITILVSEKTAIPLLLLVSP